MKWLRRWRQGIQWRKERKQELQHGPVSLASLSIAKQISTTFLTSPCHFPHCWVRALSQQVMPMCLLPSIVVAPWGSGGTNPHHLREVAFFSTSNVPQQAIYFYCWVLKRREFRLLGVVLDHELSSHLLVFYSQQFPWKMKRTWSWCMYVHTHQL